MTSGANQTRLTEKSGEKVFIMKWNLLVTKTRKDKTRHFNLILLGSKMHAHYLSVLQGHREKLIITTVHLKIIGKTSTPMNAAHITCHQLGGLSQCGEAGLVSWKQLQTFH